MSLPFSAWSRPRLLGSRPRSRRRLCRGDRRPSGRRRRGGPCSRRAGDRRPRCRVSTASCCVTSTKVPEAAGSASFSFDFHHVSVRGLTHRIGHHQRERAAPRHHPLDHESSALDHTQSFVVLQLRHAEVAGGVGMHDARARRAAVAPVGDRGDSGADPKGRACRCPLAITGVAACSGATEERPPQPRAESGVDGSAGLTRPGMAVLRELTRRTGVLRCGQRWERLARSGSHQSSAQAKNRHRRCAKRADACGEPSRPARAARRPAGPSTIDAAS